MFSDSSGPLGLLFPLPKMPFPCWLPPATHTPLFTWRTITFLQVSTHLIWKALPDHSHFPKLNLVPLPWTPIVPWASFSLCAQTMFMGKIKYSALIKDIWAYGSQGGGWTMLCNSGMKGLGIKMCWVWIPALALMRCMILINSYFTS